MIFNKVKLVPNLNILFNLLNNDYSDEYTCNFIYGERIAIKHYTQNNQNVVRIWKTNSLFDYFYSDHLSPYSTFIGAIDYTINDDHVKIDFLCINDDENKNNYEMLILKKSLINFIKNLANEKNKSKIIVDVHKNLRLYKKYYSNEGFKQTNRKCTDNPYWIEAEFNSI